MSSLISEVDFVEIMSIGGTADGFCRYHKEVFKLRCPPNDARVWSGPFWRNILADNIAKPDDWEVVTLDEETGEPLSWECALDFCKKTCTDGVGVAIKLVHSDSSHALNKMYEATLHYDRKK